MCEVMCEDRLLGVEVGLHHGHLECKVKITGA